MKRRVWAGVLWCLALCWMALCFYLSWQTGEETVGVSLWVAKLLLRLLEKMNIRPNPATFHTNLRTLAHWGAFFAAGGLFGGALAVSLWGRKRWLMWTFLGGMLICTLSAGASEIIKLWIPGRHLQWEELGLNVVGALCGVLPACLIGWLATGKKRARRS